MSCRIACEVAQWLTLLDHLLPSAVHRTKETVLHLPMSLSRECHVTFQPPFTVSVCGANDDLTDAILFTLILTCRDSERLIGDAAKNQVAMNPVCICYTF